MNKGLIAKKLGMTQIFDENGAVIPVTVLEAGPCTVVQIKNDELSKEYLEEIKKSMHYIDKKVKTNKENKTEGIIIGKYNEKYQIIFTSNPNIIMNKTIKY